MFTKEEKLFNTPLPFFEEDISPEGEIPPIFEEFIPPFSFES